VKFDLIKKSVTEYKLINVKREFQPAFDKWFQNKMNKFDDKPNNLSFVVVATMLLWVCWLFFNAGTVGSIYEERYHGSAKIMINTLISGAISGIVAQFLRPRIIVDKKKTKVLLYDVGALCNGILCGLVSITGVCHAVDPEFAFMIGVLAGVIYVLGAKLFIICKIDDPLEAGVVHGIGGMWGLIAAGLFDNRSGLLVTNFDEFQNSCAGKERIVNFNQYEQFGIQIVGLAAIATWTGVNSYLFFKLLDIKGLFRIKPLDEVLG
jgi:Amt family ammonium transporter